MHQFSKSQLTAVLLLLIAGLLLPAPPAAEAARKRADREASVLVIPFNAAQLSRVEWLSPGIAACVAEVARETGLSVFGPHEALQALSKRGLSAEPERLIRDPLGVARELGASHVVSGNWAAEGLDGIAIQASTFDVAADLTLEQVSSRGPMVQLGSVLGSLVLQLVDEGQRERAAPAVARLAELPYTDLAAWMRVTEDPTRTPGRLPAGAAR